MAGHLNRPVSDAVTDLLEDLYYRGKITLDEKENYNQQLATDFGLTDLLRQPIHAGASMSTETIVIRHAKKEITEGLLNELKQKYKEQLGYAGSLEGKFLTCSDGSPNDLDTYLGATADEDFHFFLSSKVAEKPADQQPYVLMKDNDGNPRLVMFIAGMEHPTTFVEEFVREQIDYLYELVQGNFDNLTVTLQNKVTMKQWLREAGDGAYFLFVADNGVAFPAYADDLKNRIGEYAWGSISHHFPEGGTKVEAPKSTGNPLLDRLAAKSAANKEKLPEGVHATTAERKQFITTKDAEAANAAKAAAEAAKTDTAIPKTAVTDALIFPPLEACKSKSHLNNWYNRGWGAVPKDADVAVDKPDKAVGMPSATLKEHLKADVRYTLTKPGQPSPKDTRPAHVPTEATLPVAPGTTAGGYPIVPAAQKDIITAKLKTLDIKSQTIPSPEQLDDIIKKGSSFWDMYPDVDRAQFILNCPPSFIEEMFQKWPQSALALFKAVWPVAMAYVVMKAKEQAGEKASEELAPVTSKNPLLDRVLAKKKSA